MSEGSDGPATVIALRADLVAARVLVWTASRGRSVALTSEAHLFFFDRYQRLAAYHRRRGHPQRAAQLQAKADEHRQHTGGDGPPYTAAIGMPRPRQWVVTDAIGTSSPHPPDDAA